ncbi:MAG: molybdopterin molybdenumtransferase MoeA [Chloroflexi bacterium]|nr:molybdopterin molybdenumtransferase MoeA [Chloroflexota bacterium]|tara:strand:- start:1833 stop:3176 length:1344 start_codon:yes stop_codon:yes gene_type:complete
MTQHKHVHSHPFTPNMLTVEDALERVLAVIKILEQVNVGLMESDNLILAEDIYSSLNIPSLNNSAMDGYAVRAIDTKSATAENPVQLDVKGQIQAGDLPSVDLSPGTAIRIMTGAPIPKGADSVVPYELTDEKDQLDSKHALEYISIFHSPNLGDHVRPAGEDTSIGDLVLKSGYELNPAGIGMLAALGLNQIPVIKRPEVAILATGNEVQSPGEILKPGHLYDSNTYGIATAIKRWGAIPKIIGIASDNLDDIRKKIQLSLHSDLLITSAGVSGGAYDLVKNVLSDLGTVDFWSVKMRPAKPIAFGLLKHEDRGIPHIGLPGNPVSALVALVEFARPAIMKMMGKKISNLPTVEAILDDSIENTDGRRVYARVHLYEDSGSIHAKLTGSQGSNLLTSMTSANGLAICHEDLPKLAKGNKVIVQLLDWLDQYNLLTEQKEISVTQGK